MFGTLRGFALIIHQFENFTQVAQKEILKVLRRCGIQKAIAEDEKRPLSPRRDTVSVRTDHAPALAKHRS
jgi:hypothetical protein